MRTAKEKHDKAASIVDGFLGWSIVDQLDVLANLYSAIASTAYEYTNNKEEAYQAFCGQLDGIKKLIRKGNKYAGQ